MIARPEWFSPRRFGWGLGIRTKEGVIYIAAILLLVFVTSTFLPEGIRPFAAGAIIAVAVVDTLTIMPKVYGKLDERETQHQLVAERNASFAGVACLAGIILYASAAVPLGVPFNPDMIVFPIIVLLAMSVVKGATLLHVEKVS